jgi:hypothetical protein
MLESARSCQDCWSKGLSLLEDTSTGVTRAEHAHAQQFMVWRLEMGRGQKHISAATGGAGCFPPAFSFLFFSSSKRRRENKNWADNKITHGSLNVILFLIDPFSCVHRLEVSCYRFCIGKILSQLCLFSHSRSFPVCSGR